MRRRGSTGSGLLLGVPQASENVLDGGVVEALGPTPVAIDEILRATGVRPGELHLILMELTIAGRLERHPGGRVALVP